ncbi:MAG: hypothetical protein V5A31_13440 [Haloferacaceae archaeon]
MEPDDGLARDDALDVVESVLDAVETDPTPVPVREVWVYGDVALGLDPIRRLRIYVTKDLLFESSEVDSVERYGVEGVGSVVDAEWAEAYPDHVRANDAGYAAPERCLAAQLLPPDEPVHLEVCNASFDDNVTRRLEGALARNAYDEILDPRGVQLWGDGRRAEETLAKLRDGALPFPTLPEALGMLGVDEETARTAAAAMNDREAGEGRSVRGDVV